MNQFKPLLALLLFFPFILLAQTRTISGTVTDDRGAPAPNVSVQVKGGRTVLTDVRGHFSIPVTGAGTISLTLSSVGLKPITITADDKKEMTIQMERDATTLQEVVIGYQTVPRSKVSGSVSSLAGKQIKDVPLSSAAEALQGRLAGVSVTASEGAPGSDIIVRVRGGGSITQDNSPLYIVDGVVVENALSVISPQDIASIDVLKDASTTAIYGARAANGVVIITTKGGRPGKTQISYNGSFGWRELPKMMDVMNPYDFVVWQYERSRGNRDDSTSFVKTYGSTWDTLNVYKDMPAVNWQNEVFGRNAKYSNQNVSVNGGSENTTYNLSLTGNKEDGVQLESGFDRYLVNFKLEHKASEKLKIGFNARYLDQTIRGAGTTNSGTRATNRLRHTINYRPFLFPSVSGGAVPDIDDFDDAYYLASSGATNPVLLTQAEYRRQYTKATYLSGFFNYTIVKNLSFRSTFGFDNAVVETDQFFSKITATARNFASLPTASVGEQYNNTFSNSNTLQYAVNDYKGHHDISILAGQEIIDQRVRNSTFETRYFPSDITAEKALENMGAGSAPPGSAQPLPTTFKQPPSRISSFFGRASYSYDDKYSASFSLRADRSSKFSSDNGTLVFPSGSVSWRFSQEAFMKDLSWLNDAKLRFGYGSVGNNRIDNLLYLQLYGVTGQYAFNHIIQPGVAPTALQNPDLRWERNTTMNLGLDWAMLNNRLQFTVDVYKNTAKDLLLAVNIPPTLGYTTQLQNLGATSNRGIEFQVSAIPISKKDFSWNTNFNISFNKNKVESLGGVSQMTRNSGWQGSDGVDDYLVKVGEPAGLMYGFVTDGFFKVDDFDFDGATQTYKLKANIANNGVYGTAQPGMLKWKDISGPNGEPDGQITADYDRVVIGNANPKFTGGWNNQFTYKSFDLSVFVNFVYGNDIYNANKIEWTDGAFPNLNTLNIMKDRFTNINANGQRVTDPKELAALNENAKIWTPVRVQRWWLHSWAIEDGSYLRFNNITVGYSLPKTVINKIKLTTFRVFATVNNLATLTSYSGFDPDVTARRSDPLTPGVDFAAYPRSRTWVFGLNVTF
ncbi:SusC/RagA family protein [Niastella yeongjuensis]|uniref:SusC/RagA family protein n=1 Tax=Niastella yeongjuensis TaxID=354355 RepID=A0A1V9EN63_9BACT|nr:TonB-dependent receptor [Niastella yeongjuensis]OQP47384.1 SusC/RagA family protein [Niastella yeongjuensis]SEN81607.1 TonB-linked outer membrane protein, SusC/RagA family [Niastella yeongjuensis]